MMKSLFSLDGIISVFRAPDSSNGTLGNGHKEALINVGDKDDDLNKVHSYIKFERLFSWLHSLLTALFLYTVSVSFISGLAMPKGTVVIWAEFVIDLILVYFLVHTLIDLGVNPQKLSTIPYLAVIARFAFSLLVRIIPQSETFAESNLIIWMPLCILVSAVVFVLAVRIKRSRRGKGMFVEQSEAAFLRDRKHNLDIARILTIVIIAVVLLLLIGNIYLDLNNDTLADYAALQFVTVVKYLFMLYVLFRLSSNLYHLIKRKNVNMIKWSSNFLFVVLLIVFLLVEMEFFIRIPVAVIWLVLVTLSNVTISYINE
ncbi:MAG TPA: hypothetical protein GXZ81_02115 [Fastidiosipila sp.]|nr:hypothetical protein [Fastidiosipila sp.]